MTNQANFKMDVNKKGIERLLQIAGKEMYAKVGLLEGKASEDMVEIGIKHEFGVNADITFKYKGKDITIHGLPQRSWLRMPLMMKKDELKVLITGMLPAILNAGTKDEIEQLLEQIGMYGEKIIQDSFETGGFGKWKRNMSQAYISLKGSDQPLIDTGNFRKAVSSEVVVK